MNIDVSDLFDEFHNLATLIWKHFHFRREKEEDWEIFSDKLYFGDDFGDILNYLEEQLFMAACSRRIFEKTGKKVEFNMIYKMIKLYDKEGKILPGKSSRYHSHAFDYGTPTDTNIDNEVAGGDLIPRKREDIKLIIEI